MKRVVNFTFALFGAAALAFFLGGVPRATAQLPGQVLNQETGPGIPATPHIQAVLAPTPFDGTYSVETDTQDGTCANSHWTVIVSHGQIASISPNNSNISASGLIEDDGTVSMTFRGGDNQIAHVGGTVKGGKGNGAWSSPTLLCGGVWRADKVK